MPKRLSSNLNIKIKYELVGISLVTMGIIAIISLAGLNTGTCGAFIGDFLHYLLGVGALVIPFLCIIIGLRYIWTHKVVAYSIKFWCIILLYLIIIILWHHYAIPPGKELMPDSLRLGGGVIGGMGLFLLRKLFGTDGTIIVLVGLAGGNILIITTWSLANGLFFAKRTATDGLSNIKGKITNIWQDHFVAFDTIEAEKTNFYDPSRDSQKKKLSVFKTSDNIKSNKDNSSIIASESEIEQTTKQNHSDSTTTLLETTGIYIVPSLSLLSKPLKVSPVKPAKELINNANILEETLHSFGVNAKIVNICQGPAVTRYELEPAPGVKVSRIVGLSDDLALQLAASGIRIEAPIPGKAAIGIEVPNKVIDSVPLREVLESEEFQNHKSRLAIALGKDITGQPVIADLAKMPHMLVAGATGSGKSVCINTLITSILFKASPAEVKFILIDPKMVELSNYNGISHLMTPVVTDSQKAASALRWAVQEMERRYTVFYTAGIRDIAKYNELPQEAALPLIVVIIDELADLMMVSTVDVEDAICRLAQKARAVGIHLVLATQRPSVDVITGIIKANVPSRISFAVSSQVDSRTILDTAGAEKLLGKGDMLFSPVGSSKPLRVQGAFIADDEVEKLVDFIKNQAQPVYSNEVTNIAAKAVDRKQDQPQFEDELLQDAIRIISEIGQASTSMLQRKFRIGYSRAARLIDTMEDMKIVGPNIGSKPREIIMTSDQIYTRYFNKD